MSRLLRSTAKPTPAVLPLALIAAASMLLIATPAASGVIEGQVLEWDERASYEVWLLTNLDLTRSDQPAARASVEAGTGACRKQW